MKIIRIDTEEKDFGKRLDIILKEYCPDLSRNKLIKLIKNSRVSLDDKLVTSPSFIINNIYKITIYTGLKVKKIKKKKIKLNIIMEDEHLIVLNKSPGVLTHDAGENENISIKTTTATKILYI